MGSRSTVRLGRVLGIRIGATPSWFFVLFLLIYLLTGYFGDILNGSDSEAFACAVAGALLFEASLVVHELGHAVVARRYDVPITGIDLWFFGGLAKLGRDPDTPGREFRVAAAGPAVTLVIIVGCLVAGLLASASGSVLDIATLQVTKVTPALALLGFLGGINALLLVFNLIPAYPLDGGRIAMAVGVAGHRRPLPRPALLRAPRPGLLLRADRRRRRPRRPRDAVRRRCGSSSSGWFMSQSARAAVVVLRLPGPHRGRDGRRPDGPGPSRDARRRPRAGGAGRLVRALRVRGPSPWWTSGGGSWACCAPTASTAR